MSNTMPPPPPVFPPQPPPPPRKGASNAVIIGSAAAVIAAVVATGIVVVNSRDDDKKPETTSSAKPAAGDDVVAGEEEPVEEESAEEEGSDGEESSDGEVAGLDDTVTYDSDVEVQLSKFARGTSSSYGSPENTPYVKFGVRVKNNGKATVDTSAFTASCSYGKDGKSSESIFDTERGLNGGPDTKLLAGRSITVTWACELPKAEKTIQIEVSPDMESESAIFTGDVR
ncbi:hypothetical protein ABZ921_23265 [Streptomyces atriruber]|uniref:DUF4352 domain-containing protein n=1 Tax=Streptomyces atriruber TaxID=545121 RepID=A0ABV3BRB7_9ACTN